MIENFIVNSETWLCVNGVSVAFNLYCLPFVSCWLHKSCWTLSNCKILSDGCYLLHMEKLVLIFSVTNFTPLTDHAILHSPIFCGHKPIHSISPKKEATRDWLLMSGRIHTYNQPTNHTRTHARTHKETRRHMCLRICSTSLIPLLSMSGVFVCPSVWFCAYMCIYVLREKQRGLSSLSVW